MVDSVTRVQHIVSGVLQLLVSPYVEGLFREGHFFGHGEYMSHKFTEPRRCEHCSNTGRMPIVAEYVQERPMRFQRDLVTWLKNYGSSGTTERMVELRI